MAEFQGGYLVVGLWGLRGLFGLSGLAPLRHARSCGPVAHLGGRVEDEGGRVAGLDVALLKLRDHATSGHFGHTWSVAEPSQQLTNLWQSAS